MTSKTVYLRDELLAIAAAVRDVKPTADEEATYAVIQEGEPRFAAASAPSASVPTAPSKGNRVERQQHGSAAAGAAPPAAAKDPMAALNARFSADRKWDKEDATSSVVRGGGRGGSSRVGGTDATRGGVPAGAGSGGAWRGGGGGRDRETFEEGYLYELKQNAKHKQVLQSTVEKYEALRQKEEDDVKKSELAAELDAEASRPGAVIATAPGAIDELDAMFSRLRAKEGADEEADLGLNLVPAAVENNEVTKKRSRFFSGPAESADVPPSVPQPAAAAVSHVDPFIPPVVTPIATEELLLAPSSNVVWNRKPVDAAQPQLQQPPKQQMPAKQQQQQLATPSNAANAKPAQQQPPAGRSGGKGDQQRGGKQVAKESAPTETVPNRVAASPSTTTNLSTVSSLSALSKITVGVQNQPPAPKGKNQRVWSAADLESKLLGQQPQEPQSVSGKPSAAKVTTAAVAPAKTNMGVFDASDLESQLLGSKPAGSGVQVGQPLSSPLPRSQQLQQQQQLGQPTTHSPPVAISTSAAPPSPAVPPQQAAPAPININVGSIGLPGGRPPAVIPAAVAPLPSPSMPPSAPQSTPAALPTLGQPQHQQPPTMLLPNGQQAVQLQYAQYVMAAQQRQGIQVPGVMVNPAMGGRPMQPLSASPASQGQWVVQQPAAQPTAGQQQAPTAMRAVMPMQQSGQSMPMRQHVMGGFPTAQQPAAYGGMFTHQAPTTMGGGIPMQQSAAIHHQFAMLYGQQQAQPQPQPQTQRAAPQQQQQR